MDCTRGASTARQRPEGIMHVSHRVRARDNAAGAVGLVAAWLIVVAATLAALVADDGRAASVQVAPLTLDQTSIA